MNRRGALLIVVAGAAALIAALALAFATRMRADGEAASWVQREAQARLMLIAACQYIQEASRLGWDDPATPAHEEAAGWIDVRDGLAGPKIAMGVADDSRFPIGHAARFPMHALTRPPFAVQPLAAPNAIATAPGSFGELKPYLRLPDPRPVVANGWTGPGSTVSAGNWAAFAAGDRAPRATSVGRSWFRLLRHDADTFVVACGGGGTLGFRDWNEVVAKLETAQFSGDRGTFELALADEQRLFYLVQWSPAVATSDLHNPHPCLIGPPGFLQEHYVSCPMNTSHSKQSSPAMVTVGHSQNPVGTIRWVQRLMVEPTRW